MLDNFKKWNFWLVGILLFTVTLFFISLILLAVQVNPLSFWNTVFINPLSNLISFSNLVQTFSILILTGLAVAITFKYRIYNFGVSGQMMISAMVVYVIAVAINKTGVSSKWITPFLLLMAVVIGALSGLVIAILKAYFKVHEVISTILFNFIAWEGYKGVMTSNAYHDLIIPSITNLRFSLISGPFSTGNLFSGGIIIAIIILLIAGTIFNKRTFGFKLNAIAKNEIAAKQARLNPQHQVLIILPISAAIAGMAGYLYFLAVNNHLPTLSAPIQEGYYGIVVASLVNYSPTFIFFSAVMMSFLVSPIQFHSFIYLKNPLIALIILGIFVYLMGIYPFVWHCCLQSVFIKEHWQKIKQKLWFKKTIVKEQSPEDKKSEVVHIKMNSEKQSLKNRILMWKNKIFRKKESEK